VYIVPALVPSIGDGKDAADMLEAVPVRASAQAGEAS
jgi:hypothetical protein